MVAQYQLHYTGMIIIQHLVDGMQRQIPVVPDNADYQTYLAWAAVPGNDPDPADPAPPPDPVDIADRATLTGLNATYQSMIDGLNAIQATRASLDAHATTLSAITISGANLAATQTQLTNTLRSLGTDLGTMIANIDKLANGAETMLQVLAALKRNMGR